MEDEVLEDKDFENVSNTSEPEEASQVDDMRAHISTLLQGIERYNPVNLDILESYVHMQAQENFYDFEANSAILALYKFHPHSYNNEITSLILLKALANFPYTDLAMCKCQLTQQTMAVATISHIIYLGDLLERCEFQEFWSRVYATPELVAKVSGFKDSIRKFIMYVVGSTYKWIQKTILAQVLGDVSEEVLQQWISQNGWIDEGNEMVFVAKQDELIKPKKVIEKINFETILPIIVNFVH